MRSFLHLSSLICGLLFLSISSGKGSDNRVRGHMAQKPTFKGKHGSLIVNGKVGAKVVFEKDVGDNLTVNGRVGEGTTFGGEIGNHVDINGMIEDGVSFKGKIDDRVKINGMIKNGAILAGSLGTNSTLNGIIESVEFLDSIPAGFALNGLVRKDSSGNVYVVNDKPYDSAHILYIWKANFCDYSDNNGFSSCQSYNANFASTPGKSIVFNGRVGKDVVFKGKVGSNVQFTCDLPDGHVFESDIPDGTIIGSDNLTKFSNSSTFKSAKNSASKYAVSIGPILCLGLMLL